jgi:hypothetical protein
VERWVDIKKVQAVAAITTDGWDSNTLLREELSDHYMGPILLEMVAGQCLE